MSQLNGTSKNTKSSIKMLCWPLSQYTENQQKHQGYIKALLCWALPQHIDTSKNTKATLKCCIAKTPRLP